MTPPTHLTEAERHGAADGTLAPELAAGVGDHLASCETCAADVARIRDLMTRYRQAPPPADAADLWPAVRARIEQEKVVRLAEPAHQAPAARRIARWPALALAAAAIILLAIQLPRRVPRDDAPAAATGATLVSVADSVDVYQQQATFLLNELELRRALMRPQTAASIDHDLAVIDSAIAETKLAMERDPNNRALRALLASSYRQKVELLQRVGNAG